MHTKTAEQGTPMRVVHIITRFIRGGADENTLFTCNGQAQAGDEIHLITGYYHPEMVAKLDPRVKWHYLPSLVRDPSLNDVRCLFDLFRLLRKLKPAVVHTHESKAGVLGRLAARAVKAPVIVHGVHILPFVNMPRAKRLIYLGMERAVAPFTDSFVSVSEEMQRLCLENGLGTPEGHSWVPSGMATEQYQTAEALDLASLLPAHLAGQARTIGLIGGHLEKRKQIGDLVEALAPYRMRDDWILLIAGEGPEQEALAAQIKTLGLEDHVLLLGFRSDLPRLLATVDIVAHAAGNEGLPRVVIQATLAGKPVVSPALPGLDKVVADGRNGLLNRIDDFTALAANFMALVDDPERRVQMGRAAREVDLSPWSVGTMVSRIAQAYSDAIDRKQSETSGVKRKAA
ncbi:glycosyltransferase [Novosphingobium mangrovi (ex Hu et al. 2023)]|uniref:Glycosyltransferase n=1 Tax=Novosphingobium mangrovi (ex Hu et al. 2023) TaxID=2930094 RepID=A0ABT0AC78_9SPHN|nr:glycosyltransferase [Novosphingobium mangrovi (ex Hu et al. 2023)]MCJ1960811.1 glycosyltransferase [Novosphingobium mangrovi (ex Hu et al. 2023)]